MDLARWFSLDLTLFVKRISLMTLSYIGFYSSRKIAPMCASFGSLGNRIDAWATTDWKIAPMCVIYGSLGSRTDVRDLRLTGKTHRCPQATSHLEIAPMCVCYGWLSYADWEITPMRASSGSLENRTDVHELRFTGKSHRCAWALAHRKIASMCASCGSLKIAPMCVSYGSRETTPMCASSGTLGNHPNVLQLRLTGKSHCCVQVSALYKIARKCTSFGSPVNRTNVHKLRLSEKLYECARALALRKTTQVRTSFGLQ